MVKTKPKAGSKPKAATGAKRGTRRTRVLSRRKKSKRTTRKTEADQAATAPRRRTGRPPFQPTAEQRRNVEVLAGLGLTQDEICLLVVNPTTGRPVTRDTLERYFRTELETGAPKAHAKVAESLYKRAVDLSHPQGATCAIFFAKCRMGWRERVSVDVEVRSGVLVAPARVSAEDWIAEATSVAAGAICEGEE